MITPSLFFFHVFWTDWKHGPHGDWCIGVTRGKKNSNPASTKWPNCLLRHAFTLGLRNS